MEEKGIVLGILCESNYLLLLLLLLLVVVVVVVRHFCEAVRSRPDLLLVTLRKSWERELGELLGLIVRGIGFGGNYTPGQPQSPSLVHHCERGGQRLVH